MIHQHNTASAGNCRSRGLHIFAWIALGIACTMPCIAGASTLRGRIAGTFGAQRGTMVAAGAVLEYVQSQQLPNGHVRILLQFNTNPSVRPSISTPTTNYVLSFAGAVAAPTVPNVIPINLGPVQIASVAQLGNALTVSFTMTSAVQARLINGTAAGLVIVDVPAAAYQGPSAQQTSPASSTATNGPTQIKVIRLRYADISEIVGVLVSNGGNVTPGNVFNPQPSQLGNQMQQGFNGALNGVNGGTFGQTSFQPFPQYQQPPFGQTYGEQQALGQRISDNVAIDRRLNAIILTGTPTQIRDMEQLIALLDVPVPSILLDTEVIEVTASGAKALGLDFNQSETQPISRIFNSQAAILNNIPAGAVPGSLALQSNIFLLVSQGRARVLASPKVLTQDGVPASILTGDSLPIRVTTPVGVGGVGAVSSQVEYINVGVNLQILPHVTEPGAVDANIYSQVSSVTGFTSSNDPQISTRQAQTKVNLLEGQTLVIGGLLQQRDIRNLQKIPILGDLPLVGALFRFYTETRQDTNLVITITPHIVPAPTPPPASPSGAPR